MSEIQKREYSFAPYNSDWPQKFEITKKLLLATFGTKASIVEHIGSTSIPGMDAKDLIDVLIVVENINDYVEEKGKMISLGYQIRENVLDEGSILFEKIEAGKKIENIHVFEKEAPTIDQFLDVRDYLRTHPERVREYSELKHSLKQQFPDNYQAYRNGKKLFLDETQRLGREWKQSAK